MPATPALDVKVTIKANDKGEYFATVDQDKPTVRPARLIEWLFDAPRDFPRDSILYIRFYATDSIEKFADRGCMHGSAWKDGIGEAEPDGRKIFGAVRNLAKGRFPYEIRYRLLAGGDYLLLDPEIIVEGSPEPPPLGEGKGRKKSSTRAPEKRGKAKRVIRRKSAKKAGTVKKAKRRSTKRTTKKR